MRRILCLLLTVLTSSCTVKENRSDCPCDLLVRPAEKLESEGSVVVSIVQDGKVVKQEMLDREDFEDGKCRLEVSRRPTTVTVFTGITSMNLKGGSKLDISSEHQCDELFSCSENANPAGESCDCSISLHKNFARLYLTVLNLKKGMDLSVSGTVAGYYLMDAAPCKGDFNILTENADAARGCCIRLPRQLDESLSMVISRDGECLRNIPLGTLIASTGYSFQDEDLMDIAMTLDLEKSYASVNIEGWDKVTIPIIEF